MIREVSLNEISDGKLYGINDLVKADCHDCKGCSACCQGMGKSIILDPFDVYRLLNNLDLSFEELLKDKIELNVMDGIILPNLKMAGVSEQCAFLNSEGRCSIHSYRPGICRLFPLGRYYENNSFQYFLQIHECRSENRTKIKVRKWIDTPDYKNNEPFITDWHYFIKDVQILLKSTQEDSKVKAITMYLLKTFYLTPYDANLDFYVQFNERLNAARSYLSFQTEANQP